ncbi:hypothetical protein TPA0906_71510 [Streptomyces olivaceus]|nr:hypothetical protein TPA0906_71510 [Streptomyces olivaceus]
MPVAAAERVAGKSSPPVPWDRGADSASSSPESVTANTAGVNTAPAATAPPAASAPRRERDRFLRCSEGVG